MDKKFNHNFAKKIPYTAIALFNERINTKNE